MAEIHLSDLLFLSETTASSLPRDELFERLLVQIMSLLQASRGFVLLTPVIMPITHQRIVVSLGADAQSSGAHRLVVAYALHKSGKPIHGEGLQLDATLMRAAMAGRLVNSPVPGRAGVARSCLCAPLGRDGRTFGVLYLDDERRGTFSIDDVYAVQLVAAMASLFADQLRVSRHLLEVQSLHDMTRELAAVSREDEMADKIFPRLIARLGFHCAALLLTGPTRDSVQLSYMRGQDGSPFSLSSRLSRGLGRRAFSIPLQGNEALLGRNDDRTRPIILTAVRRLRGGQLQALVDGQCCVIRQRQLAAALRFFAYPSCVVAPCVIGGNLLGILVASRGIDPPDQDRQYLGFVATLTAAVLDRLQQHNSLNAKLLRANDRLQEQAAREQNFSEACLATDLGHAFANPVSVIKQQLNLLRQALSSPTAGSSDGPGPATTHLRIMDDEVERLESVCMNLSSRSLPDFAPQHQVIYQCVTQACDLIRILFPNLNIKIIGSPTLEFSFDAGLVASAVRHVCLNAERATRHRRNAELRVELRPHNDGEQRWLVLSMHDNGDGIEPDMLRLLMTHRDAEWSVPARSRLRGRGIPFCRRIAELHVVGGRKGRFVLKSELGKGTDAQFVLPI